MQGPKTQQLQPFITKEPKELLLWHLETVPGEHCPTPHTGQCQHSPLPSARGYEALKLKCNGIRKIGLIKGSTAIRTGSYSENK